MLGLAAGATAARARRRAAARRARAVQGRRAVHERGAEERQGGERGVQGVGTCDRWMIVRLAPDDARNPTLSWKRSHGRRVKLMGERVVLSRAVRRGCHGL